MAWLMTPTLWDSIDWLHKAPSSIKAGTKITWKQDAYNNLLSMLRREWAPTKAIERGISFEKQICYGKKPVVAPDLIEKFNKAYDLIHADGGNFQTKCKKFYQYDDKEFIMYGKQDVHFAPTEEFPLVKKLIVDIKTTGNYRGQSSYLSKWQHKVYTLLDRIPDFKYVVYEFDNESGMIVDIHIIDYINNDFAATDKEIEKKLAEVVQFLKSDKKLKEAYTNKFNMYNN